MKRTTVPNKKLDECVNIVELGKGVLYPGKLFGISIAWVHFDVSAKRIFCCEQRSSQSDPKPKGFHVENCHA